ncbi:phosphatidylinositol-binding protein scs2 [Marasmius crinis-equi]|uniref:Phosphatidylinositol-binding protein scs2 n=1 Tax=Marasmius crinis-equi TaxID=585013 RepID=A0ABR3FYN4_9AGAR
MSVYLNPSSSLGFNRPLTVLVKRTLTITNPHDQPVAFKVKTTAPKLYCVRPNSGKVEPGQSAEVAVMLQPLKDEPPLNAKCKDKFLIQSTLITPEKEQKPLAEIWSGPDATGADAVHQQKLKVVYMPPEGQTLVEEDENAANQSSILGGGDSHYDTVRQPPPVNGHNAIPDFDATAGPSHHEDFSAAREESHEETEHPPPVSVYVQPPPVEPPSETPAQIRVQPPAPPPAPRSAPEPVPIPAPIQPPAPVPTYNPELEADLKEARAEIERLRSLLAAAAPPTELRKRSRRLSDDITVPGSDVGTIIDDGPLSQEGVPLQVVVIISLLVFVTTYLFF